MTLNKGTAKAHQSSEKLCFKISVIKDNVSNLIKVLGKKKVLGFIGPWVLIPLASLV